MCVRACVRVYVCVFVCLFLCVCVFPSIPGERVLTGGGTKMRLSIRPARRNAESSMSGLGGAEQRGGVSIAIATVSVSLCLSVSLCVSVSLSLCVSLCLSVSLSLSVCLSLSPAHTHHNTVRTCWLQRRQ